MTQGTKYVEVKLNGGVPQFIPLAQWAATDAAKRAEYIVINADLTEDQKHQRETEHARTAATTGHYAEEVVLQAAGSTTGGD